MQDLLPFINISATQFLNVKNLNHARTVFKEKDKAQEQSQQWCQSEDPDAVYEEHQEAVIVNVIFTAPVKLNAITIATNDQFSQHAPSRMAVFANKRIDFDQIGQLWNASNHVHSDDCGHAEHSNILGPITQEWHTLPTMTTYPCMTARFGQLTQLALFFPLNFTDDHQYTRLDYIGLQGTPVQSGTYGKTVDAVYEANANPADHKTKVGGSFTSQLGQ